LTLYVPIPATGLNLCCDCADPCNRPTCNDCSPQLSRTYVVTVSGLGGSFAAWNGAHTLTWLCKDGSGLISRYPCVWYSASPVMALYYEVTPFAEWWAIILGSSVLGSTPSTPNIQVDRYAHYEPCDPTGLYPFDEYANCAPYGDADCLASAGATIVVSAP